MLQHDVCTHWWLAGVNISDIRCAGTTIACGERRVQSMSVKDGLGVVDKYENYLRTETICYTDCLY